MNNNPRRSGPPRSCGPEGLYVPVHNRSFVLLALSFSLPEMNLIFVPSFIIFYILSSFSFFVFGLSGVCKPPWARFDFSDRPSPFSRPVSSPVPLFDSIVIFTLFYLYFSRRILRLVAPLTSFPLSPFFLRHLLPPLGPLFDFLHFHYHFISVFCRLFDVGVLPVPL